MTIHQFLLKQGWLMQDTFELRKESAVEPFPASTVVVDECSMIPVNLFGTLLQSLNTGPLKRLILVGDPNQLPPIGPGRPFSDTIEWLKLEHPQCIASLIERMRVNEDEPTVDSVALALADGYQAVEVNPGDDEILATVARGGSCGDLEVVFWEDHDQLLEQLVDRMSKLLRIRDYKSFNQSLGISTREWDCSETWQILSPTRAQHFGTTDLNRLIQGKFKGGLIHNAKSSSGRFPRPFGEQEIVWSDKVIQINNKSKSGWPRETGLDYVANGEIGIVKNTEKNCFDVVFSTQTSPEVSYRYYRQQVNDELELAYAITVHRAQGSDFDTVFLIVPQHTSSQSRELIYTGLTRFRSTLVLLIEKDIEPLRRLRSSEYSNTKTRNTFMFKLLLRPDNVQIPRSEALIHRTSNGTVVRSKSEVVVANILDRLGISYQYEQPLHSRKDSSDFRLPDFTASFEGDIYYWEHLGMLNNPSYKEAWDRKLKWYEENDFTNQLIISRDAPNGSIDAEEIENLAKLRILSECDDYDQK